MKKSNDKPAPIAFKSSAKETSFDEIELTSKMIVTDSVDNFWFEKNEYKTPNTLDYEVSADKKTIILKEYPSKTDHPQLIFYFNTDSKISQKKEFDLNIVFPKIAKKIYKTGNEALSVKGLRCNLSVQELKVPTPKYEEQETEKGIIYFPDINP